VLGLLARWSSAEKSLALCARIKKEMFVESDRAAHSQNFAQIMRSCKFALEAIARDYKFSRRGVILSHCGACGRIFLRDRKIFSIVRIFQENRYDIAQTNQMSFSIAPVLKFLAR
jgi:hypothetical protein